MRCACKLNRQCMINYEYQFGISLFIYLLYQSEKINFDNFFMIILFKCGGVFLLVLIFIL